MTPQEFIEAAKKKKQTAPAAPVTAPVTQTVPKTPQEFIDAARKKEKHTQELVKHDVESKEAFFETIVGKAKEAALRQGEKAIKDATSWEQAEERRKILEDIDKFYQPGEIVAFAGGKPVRQGEKEVFGFISAPEASKAPVNVKGAKPSFGDAFRPQTIVGPVAKEQESSQKKSPYDRAMVLLPEASFTEYVKENKLDPAQTQKERERFEAQREALQQLIKDNPYESDEAIFKQLSVELTDLGPSLEGTSKRKPHKKSDPGNVSAIAGIYGRGSVAAMYPDLTPSQAAYLQKYHEAASSRLVKEQGPALRKKLSEEMLPAQKEIVGAASEVLSPAQEARLRTPEEVESAYKTEIKQLTTEYETPWWASKDREKIAAEPEKYAKGNWFTGKTYETGAIKEGWGGYALRMVLSPMNVTASAITSGAIRGGEALGRGSSEEAQKIPSSLDVAREKRGGKAAALGEGFVADLADAVTFNRSAAPIIQDNFKELGHNETLGFALGFGLDIIAPPVAGVPTAIVAGTKGFNAGRAIRAAELIGPSPIKAATTSAGSALRTAWTWRNTGATILPGTLKTLAADKTGKMLAEREAARAAGLDTPIAANIEDIPDKGHIWSGSKKLLERFDKEIGDELKMTVVINGAARSEKISQMLGQTAGKTKAGKIATGVRQSPEVLYEKAIEIDPTAMSQAKGAVVAFDAFNQSSKAKGFAEFDDLVLVTDRFISTPDEALKAAESVKNTPLSQTVKAITTDNKQIIVAATEEAQKTGSTRSVEAFEMTPEQTDVVIAEIMKGRNTGRLRPDEARVMLDGAEKGNIAINDVRKLLDLQIEDALMAAGKAVDTKNIKAVAGNKWALGNQIIAREAIFTPKEMRSVFDGVTTRIKLALGDSKTAIQQLDLPPTTIKRIEELKARTAKIENEIKSLMRDLSGPNPELRKAYGLAPKGQLTQEQILNAIVRGRSTGKDAALFYEAVAKLLMSGYEDTPHFFNRFMKRSWKSTNFEHFSPEIQFAIKDAINKAITRSKAKENATSIVKDLRDELVAIQEKLIASPGVDTVNFLKVEDAEIPQLIGGALYTREANKISEAIKNSTLVDNTIVVELTRHRKLIFLLGEKGAGTPDGINLGLPKERILALLLEWGQQIVEQGRDQFLRSLRLHFETLMKNSDATSIMKEIEPITGDLVAAYKQTVRRAELSGESVEDIAAKLSKAQDGTPVAKSLITGEDINDSLTQFFSTDNFTPVMEALGKNMPKNKQAAQLLVDTVWSGLELLGNLRYNMMLYTRPTYHVTNAVTAPFMIHAIAGAENSPGAIAYGIAANTIAKNATDADLGKIAFVSDMGKPYTFRDVLDLGINSGLLKSEQQVLFAQGTLDAIIEDVSKMSGVTSKTMKDLKFLLNMPADVASGSDNLFRTATLIKALKSGKPISVAQDISKKSLLDYGSLSQSERAFASRFFLFYSFSRTMAEQILKSIGNPAAAARFAKQAGFIKNAQELAWEKSGGEDYSYRRFYQPDKDLARIALAPKPGTAVRGTEYERLFVPFGHLDGFMQVANLMWSKDITSALVGTETGPGQWFDPLIKEIMTTNLPDTIEGRAQEMRLLSPEHAAVWHTAPALFESIFGELRPLIPTKETTKTYDGMEWQLSPEGYRTYSAMAKAAELAGFSSTVNYWIPQLSSKFDRPGIQTTADSLLDSFGLKTQARMTLAQQEEASLKESARTAQERVSFEQKQNELRAQNN